jgi:hypothetical protein
VEVQLAKYTTAATHTATIIATLNPPKRIRDFTIYTLHREAAISIGTRLGWHGLRLGEGRGGAFSTFSKRADSLESVQESPFG